MRRFNVSDCCWRKKRKIVTAVKQIPETMATEESVSMGTEEFISSSNEDEALTQEDEYVGTFLDYFIYSL